MTHILKPLPQGIPPDFQLREVVTAPSGPAVSQYWTPLTVTEPYLEGHGVGLE